MDNQITFIIPNRGGKHINFIIKRLNAFYPGSKYIVITQDDNKPFMRGQLWNIAYKYIDTDYMCFIDNDMFFPKFVDLIKAYNQLNCIALQPFKIIRQVEIVNGATVKKLSEARKGIYGKGGATFISKSNFEKIGGMSNLYIGYGCEDSDFDYRSGGIADINEVICHIQHKRRNNDYHWDINKQIFNDVKNRDTQKDSFADTKYTLVKESIDGNTTLLSVKDIIVDESFEYQDILKKHS